MGVYHKALLCEVLVGRSYTIDRNQMEDTELPPGYSSFYIQPSDDTSRVLDPQRKEYYHEYYIKNPLQVMPRYLIHYEYDEKLETAARQKPKCDDCEKELATVYCEADKAYLCKLCDANLHKTKITRMHVRKAIGEVCLYSSSSILYINNRALMFLVCVKLILQDKCSTFVLSAMNPFVLTVPSWEVIPK